MRDFTETVKAAIRALNSAGAEYVIVGGLVAIFYGRPRTTTDVDIIIDFDRTDPRKLGDSLKKESFDATLAEIQKALAEGSHFTVFDTQSPYRLDVQGVYKGLDEASFGRRRKGVLFGELAWIESPEDLIIAKLVYGSQQDLEDDLAILIRQKSRLDVDYLDRQAEKNKVSTTLKKLLKSVEES
jgi:uncharacterized protein (DUF1330 family)